MMSFNTTGVKHLNQLKNNKGQLQSSPQQLRRGSQQLISDQQFQRQEQTFNQNLSVLVAQNDKLLKLIVSIMGIVSKLLPKNSSTTAQAFTEFLPANVAQP